MSDKAVDHGPLNYADREHAYVVKALPALAEALRKDRKSKLPASAFIDEAQHLLELQFAAENGDPVTQQNARESLKSLERASEAANKAADATAATRTLSENEKTFLANYRKSRGEITDEAFCRQRPVVAALRREK